MKRMKRTLFGCMMEPPRPESHKSNALFLNAIILNSDELFSLLGPKVEEFKSKTRSAFQNVEGEKIHSAIDELYHKLESIPATEHMARCIMNASRSSSSVDGVAAEEEMISLRDRWLRRVNNSKSEGEESTTESTQSSIGGGFIALPVFFATNRNEVGGKVKRFYGTGRAEQVSFGLMWVSLPDTHRYGEVDSPTWRYSASRKGAPRNKIVHLSTVPLKGVECIKKLNKIMSNIGEKEAVMFVHGYNSTLANAVQRMAQVAYTGNFRGPTFVFSWPSNQSMASYTADEANVMWAVQDFLLTLKMLMCDLGMEKVHLLAHSMGSRLVLYALLRLHASSLPAHAAKIGRLVLAAPDFDMLEFMTIVGDVASRVERITLYCSADDHALQMSRSLHGGFARLGDFRGFVEMSTNPHMRALENLDAIDTTGTDNSWLRHAYVFDACGIIIDCCMVLRVGLPPHERASLVLATLPGGQVYWTFNTTATGLLAPSALKASTELLYQLGSRLQSLGFKSLSGKKAIEGISRTSTLGNLPSLGSSLVEEVGKEGEMGNGDAVEIRIGGNEQLDEVMGEEVVQGPETGELTNGDDGMDVERTSHRRAGDIAPHVVFVVENEDRKLATVQASGNRDGSVDFKLMRLESKRYFMDEFGRDFLRDVSTGGTLDVSGDVDDLADVGGGDVTTRGPSKAEQALELSEKGGGVPDGNIYRRSKSMAATQSGKLLSRSFSLSGSEHGLLRRHGGSKGLTPKLERRTSTVGE
eukprot:TRINITY_DN19971_c0_g1_i1.p1 TRINITY_DN19971_c0_g1~~TRINITY_DN19971_c0_g1_i1.p1  ORF type:complete len:754 (+),score=117.17 TRINITY_DN19971_c0_g1_i1:699-2960(+)